MRKFIKLSEEAQSAARYYVWICQPMAVECEATMIGQIVRRGDSNMTITTTRADCTRDNVAVHLPNASTLGFGRWKAKRGNWVRYEANDFSYVGRVISRVVCEGQIYVEVACAAPDFSSAYVRWVKPKQIKECRANPPTHVFQFFSGDWSKPKDIHAKLAYGVSDLKDQMPDWFTANRGE